MLGYTFLTFYVSSTFLIVVKLHRFECEIKRFVTAKHNFFEDGCYNFFQILSYTVLTFFISKKQKFWMNFQPLSHSR